MNTITQTENTPSVVRSRDSDNFIMNLKLDYFIKDVRTQSISEETNVPKVPVAESNTICIVYNKFDAESIVAAALYKKVQETANIPVHLIDISAQCLLKSDQYVWIGVDPSNHKDKLISLKKTFHVVYLNGDLTKVKWDNTMKSPYFNYHFAEIDHTLCPVDTDQGIIQKVREVLNTNELPGIEFRLKMFYDVTVKQTMVQLAATYATVISAVTYLSKNIPMVNYLGDDTLDQDIVQYYLKEVGKVREVLDIKSMSIFINNDKGNRHRVLYTVFNDERFIVAKRLILIAKKDYLNHNVGLGGQYMYTNVPGLSEDKFKEQLKV